jgi:ribokinase
MFDVCVVGSANLDLVASARIPRPGETVLATGYAEHAGGKGLNQAVAAARSGASTAMVATVGADPAGDTLVDVMREVGIDHRHVRRLDLPTGRALITVADDGENAIVVVPGANGGFRFAGGPPARVVLAQLEVPVAEVVAAFVAGRRAGAVTVLNPAPATELPDELLAVCDVVVPNEHEIEVLGGVDALLAAGVGTVLVTRGSAGVDVVTAEGTFRQPPFAVEVVDTTGAGDAFCGAFAARRAAGDALDQAVRWAAAAGALATTVAGAVPSLPRAEAVRELLSAAAPPPPSPPA